MPRTTRRFPDTYKSVLDDRTTSQDIPTVVMRLGNYHSWAAASQELRDLVVSQFEQAIFDAYDCFPKPNYIRD